MTKEEKRREAEAFAEMKANLELNELRIQILARREALKIVAHIVNAFTTVHKLTDEEYAMIQKQVNAEDEETMTLFEAFKKGIQG